jgi:hypothetical protein
MFHGGFTFVEAWNLPIAWRRWFINRINIEHEKQNNPSDGNDQSNSNREVDIRRLLETSPIRRKKF